MSQWIKVISTGGGLRGVAVELKSVLSEIVAQHQMTDPAAIQALGELACGGVLLAAGAKSGERININIQGKLGQFRLGLVDARPEGTVRGYIAAHEVVDVIEQGTRGPWGQGVVSVLRTKGSENAPPYIGTVELVTGHFAKDLTFYLLQSEQIASAVGFRVRVSPNGVIETAVGFLVQAMPTATPEEVARVEAQIPRMAEVFEKIPSIEDPMLMFSVLFENESFIRLEEKPLRFQCECSIDRVRRSLLLVGRDEIESMLGEQRSFEIQCDFCSKSYSVGTEILQELLSAQ